MSMIYLYVRSDYASLQLNNTISNYTQTITSVQLYNLNLFQ